MTNRTADGTATEHPSRQDLGLDGRTLLHTVATALVLLSRQRNIGDQGYGDAVQRAYNQLVLRAILNGTEPPASVPGMVSWAGRTPLGEWPVDLSTTGIDGSELLVDAETRTPTQACFEWAMPVADAPTELFENAVMDEALAACRAARSPESYSAFRRLLITRPVLTVTELLSLAAEVNLMPVYELIRRCYEPVPAAYRGRDGGYRLCGRCGCLLLLLRAGGYRCELDRCRNDGAAIADRTLAVQDRLLQVRRPLRVFVTSPGLAETDLDAALRARRLVPEMWPQFDAYDLRVTFANGTAWAVDVKDWANPSLLGARMRAFDADPPYDKAFIVIPEYRFRLREDYARAFRHALAPELRSHMTVCSDAEFIKKASKEARDIERAVQSGGSGHAQ